MEKYRIAVGIPTLKDCSLEAIACTEHLSRKGISAEWENKGYFFQVNTKKGHIEFVPYKSFKIESIFMGKRYSAMFNVPRDSDKSFYPGVTILTNCFLDWVEIAESAKEEKDEKTYDTLAEREISYNCEQASLFEMVAEECAELSHVSSKIARYLRKDQPVSEDFNIMSAFTNFLEEFADVYLAARVAWRSTDSSTHFDEEKFEKFYYNKLERWIKRLHEKNETSEE